MIYWIDEVEDIDKASAELLCRRGVLTMEDLSRQAKCEEGRRRLAKETGIDAAAILRWFQMSELMKVRGIGGKYAQLLIATGVKTLSELLHRDPVALTKDLVAVNDDRGLVLAPPVESDVRRWHSSAKSILGSSSGDERCCSAYAGEPVSKAH